MVSKLGKTLCAAALLCALSAPAGAMVRQREDGPGGFFDRIVQFLKQIPKPHLPGILDDLITPPKP